MAQTHPTATRNAIARAVTALVDEGQTYDAGRLVLFNREGVPCCTFSLAPPPAFRPPVEGIADAYPIAPTTDFRSGEVPARFEVHNRDGAVVWRGSVRPGGDLDMGRPGTLPNAAGKAFIHQFAYVAGI
jgi:hypothetical protein